MAGAINFAIRHIEEKISSSVLKLAFKDKNRRLNNVISLSERIKAKVIVSKVLKDIAPYSGIEAKLPLSDARITTVDSGVPNTFEYVVEFSTKRMGNRKIVNVSDISTSVGYGPSLEATGNQLMNALEPMMPSGRGAIIDSITRIDIVGDNILYVSCEGSGLGLESMYLNCNVSSGEAMGHISPRQHMDFAKLCLEAAKSIIHTKLYDELDEGYIQGGHNISRIKDIVDRYEDADEKYDELYEAWKKQETFSNSKLTTDLIKCQIL